jgi:EmrB/QacA subfamily drug resistance transporter
MTSTPPPSPQRTTATIAVACIAAAMLILDISVINTALSAIAESLHSGLDGLQWLVDAYTLPLAAVVLTAGSLADRFGRRAAFLGGLSLFTGASALCGLSGSIAVLDGARAVQGVGASVMFAVSLALIAEVTPTHVARTKALAMYGATIGAALAVGPFVGGGLTDLLGWRSIFLINLPLGLLAIAVTATRVGESRDPRARRIDWPGQLTLVTGLFGVVLGLLRGNVSGWHSTLVLTSLIGGGVLLAGFVAIELRRTEPMLPLQLFGHRDFAGTQLSVFGIAASIFSAFLYLSLYLQGPVGLTALETGLAYLPGSVLMFMVSVATPRLAARWGFGTVVTIGLSLVTAGLALLLAMTRADSSWAVTLPATLLTFAGAGLFNTAASVIAVGTLPAGQSGLASGAYDTFRQSGIALGTAAQGALLPAAGSLGGGVGTAYVTGFHHALWLATGIAAVATVGSAALLGRHRLGHAPAVETPLEAAAEAVVEGPSPSPSLDLG